MKPEFTKDNLTKIKTFKNILETEYKLKIDDDLKFISEHHAKISKYYEEQNSTDKTLNNIYSLLYKYFTIEDKNPHQAKKYKNQFSEYRKKATAYTNSGQMTDKEKAKWINYDVLDEKIKELEPKRNDDFETNQKYLMLIIHKNPPLRTSFYFDLKVYTTKTELNKIIDNGKYDHNLVFAPKNGDGFYYVHHDKITWTRKDIKEEMNFLTIDKNMRQMIYESVNKFNRNYLFVNPHDHTKPMTQKQFLEVLREAVGKDNIDNRTLRKVYQSKSVEDFKRGKMTPNEFVKDAYKLRHCPKTALQVYYRQENNNILEHEKIKQIFGKLNEDEIKFLKEHLI